MGVILDMQVIIWVSRDLTLFSSHSRLENPHHPHKQPPLSTHTSYSLGMLFYTNDELIVILWNVYNIKLG